MVRCFYAEPSTNMNEYYGSWFSEIYISTVECPREFLTHTFFCTLKYRLDAIVSNKLEEHNIYNLD